MPKYMNAERVIRLLGNPDANRDFPQHFAYNLRGGGAQEEAQGGY